MFRRTTYLALMLVTLTLVAAFPAAADGRTGAGLLDLDGPTRGQMAVGLLQAVEVAGFTPPDCVDGEETFDDVPASSPFCPWIEELVRRGITTGCDEGRYCPAAPVNRSQMAIFLVRSLEATKDLFAVVDADGELVRGRGAVSSLGGFNGPGTYQVNFDTDVRACAYIATLGGAGTDLVDPGFITTATRNGTTTAVFVATFDINQELAERGFHLRVVC